LHVTFINHPETPIDEWYHLEHAAHVDLYRCVADMGGSISGEHGIGSKRCDYLGQVMDARLIQLQKDIKMVFDPNNVLNPGKIFPWKRSM